MVRSSPLLQNLTSISALLDFASRHDLELHHMDFVTAFLNGYIGEDLYMEIPDGVESMEEKDFVCKFQK